MFQDIFSATRHLSDLEFEHQLALVRRLRAARAEEIAHERQLAIATRGTSIRFAEAAARSGADKLIAALVSGGLSPREAARHAAETR